jgi:formiminoglutamase
MAADFITIRRGAAPLIVSLPHTGTDIPSAIEAGLVSPWLARKDADWWIERLYDFAADLDATIVRTAISRTVIDVNRDPSGASLYPGQATTELCPTTTFDGEPLYRPGAEPNELDVASRRSTYFAPYHQALAEEIRRLRAQHPHVVLYDCHSIRSVVPRLFEGMLPNFNIGTNGGTSCDPEVQRMAEEVCGATDFSLVSNGRFKGGWITRRYGAPDEGVHAIQMELACRGYMAEPLGPVTPNDWPAPYDPAYAAPMRAALTRLLEALAAWARSSEGSPR